MHLEVEEAGCCKLEGEALNSMPIGSMRAWLAQLSLPHLGRERGNGTCHIRERVGRLNVRDPD